MMLQSRPCPGSRFELSLTAGSSATGSKEYTAKGLGIGEA